MDNIHETQKPVLVGRSPGSAPAPGTVTQGVPIQRRPFEAKADLRSKPLNFEDGTQQPNVQSVFAAFEQAWARAQSESDKRLRALSPEARPLVQAQILVNRLNLGSQLIAQTAEAVGSTTRRVQQLGGS